MLTKPLLRPQPAQAATCSISTPCTDTLQVPAATLSLTLNITQPLMRQTGQLRWAMNNVASQQPTPCQPLLDLVHEDPQWFERNAVPSRQYNKPGFNSTALGVQARPPTGDCSLQP